MVATVHRDKKLTRLARGMDCMVRIPDICNHNPETVVAAHANQMLWGKGAGCKAHDFAIAFACSDCHREIDQGKRFTRDAKDHFWLVGFIRTQAYLWMNNLVRVA